MKSNLLLLLAFLGMGPLLLKAHPGHEDLRHWETASPDPDRIMLTWTGDPATSVAATWRTDSSVTAAFAEIAPGTPDARFDVGARRIEATTEALELEAHPQPQTHYHSVFFEDLEPDTLYAYRVGGGEERWSEWIQFRTAKAEAAPFSFLYFGDAQNAVRSHWSRVIRAAYQKAPHAAFSLHAGDLVNRAHRDREWAEWFEAGGWIHASVPSLPVAGNHEYARVPSNEENRQSRLSLQWRKQFALPVESSLPEALAETVYFVDYQGVRFIVLNSNRGIEAQVGWLDGVLADNPNRWTVISLHHPIFSSGRGRDNEANREALKPIIDKHQVDLLLQGHDHTYARGHVPVGMSESGEEKVRSLYVNSVSGPKMYEFQKDGWDIYKPDGVMLDRKAENTQFFQVIDVDGAWLNYRAFMADGTLYDAFRLRKEADGTKTLHKIDAELGPERSFENTKPYNLEGL